MSEEPERPLQEFKKTFRTVFMTHIFLTFCHKTLGLDWIRIQQQLDPDPDPQKTIWIRIHLKPDQKYCS